MLNNLILVGRLVEKPVLRELDDGTQVCNITLAVMKPFRNANTGEYGTDFIPISLWHGTASITSQYCDKGDLIGIKGRVSTRVQEQNGINVHSVEVIGERVVFINLKSRQEGYIDNKDNVSSNVK